MPDLAWNSKKLERPRILIRRQIRKMHYHKNEKNRKIERRVDPRIRSRQAWQSEDSAVNVESWEDRDVEEKSGQDERKAWYLF